MNCLPLACGCLLLLLLVGFPLPLPYQHKVPGRKGFCPYLLCTLRWCEVVKLSEENLFHNNKIINWVPFLSCLLTVHALSTNISSPVSVKGGYCCLPS